MTFLTQLFSNRKWFLPADFLKFFGFLTSVCPAAALLTLLGLIRQHSLQVVLKFNPAMNVMECSGFCHHASAPSWFLFSTLHYLNDLFLCCITCSSVAPWAVTPSPQLSHLREVQIQLPRWSLLSLWHTSSAFLNCLTTAVCKASHWIEISSGISASTFVHTTSGKDL